MGRCYSTENIDMVEEDGAKIMSTNEKTNTIDMLKKDGAKIMSAIEKTLARLYEKEADIRSGKLVVQSKTVSLGMKSGGYSYPTTKLRNRVDGWLSEPDLEILDLREIFSFSDLHGFVIGLHLAFARDKAFTLCPDDIWLVISQGFSQHINMNAEKYRNEFVDFNGKKTITILRNSFGPDVEKNPWNYCFPEFAEKITEIIGGQNVALVLDEFSTTTVVARMAMQVVLMDMVKQYLDYRVSTCCGIPKFHIKGSPDDWAKMLKKIQKFRKFDLDWWVDDLEKILGKFLNIVSGKSDETSFLISFYKFLSGSGGDRINGEVIKLFPYLKNWKGTFEKNTGSGWGVATDSFPSGKSDVPFIWQYLGKERTMHFRTFCVPVVENGGISVKPVVQVSESRKNNFNLSYLYKFF